MRNTSSAAPEKYVAIGETIGEARGLEAGEDRGLAIGIISTARDLGAPDSYIVERLMEYLGISEEEATTYISGELSPIPGHPTIERLRLVRERTRRRAEQ